jgi:hypothetical protein
MSPEVDLEKTVSLFLRVSEGFAVLFVFRLAMTWLFREWESPR